ncbi:hypothetical protein [Thalassospira xiamenensis]|uniref:Uncharacterized protein n=1 Tax=Thalassospira xiamenensis TaxID=220697 RepID=A0ABR5XWS6_9PROT|nr:hypothetical protein [Thalassospira xiamenensis]KZC97161.1 hypothetical protein AUP40_04285 [Thalassospira xiamenensis]KZD10246.1 hypothetical protein AUP45_02925 [Thalassospira xiamenensis]MCD1593104.1 hypothetical protein [Thalassospira xiamenensis]
MAKRKAAARSGDTEWVAIIDSDGLYQGKEQVANATSRFIVPADCDLKPGQYRLSDCKTKFVPVRHTLAVKPDMAIADALQSLADAAGISLPASTAKWIAAIRKKGA